MINTFNQSPPLRQSGFSLVEILITLLVIAVGLLGLAQLQTAGLKSNHAAYQRSQAILLTNDIIDRMKANGSTPSNYEKTATEVEAATKQTNCHLAAGCSSGAMANNDLFEWNKALKSVLTGGKGSIILAGGVYSVKVEWMSLDDSSALKSFTTKFQP